MTIETHRKKKILRRLCLALMLLLLSVLQNTDGFFPQIFGVRALLLIPCVVCAAMYERDICGMLLGLFAGALWDVFASGASFNALYLTAVGFICGSLINTIMRNNIFTSAILSALFSAIYVLGYWLFNFIIPGLDSAGYMLCRYYLPSFLYTVALSPVFFLMVRAIEKKFSEE